MVIFGSKILEFCILQTNEDKFEVYNVKDSPIRVYYIELQTFKFILCLFRFLLQVCYNSLESSIS